LQPVAANTRPSFPAQTAGCGTSALIVCMPIAGRLAPAAARLDLVWCATANGSGWCQQTEVSEAVLHGLITHAEVVGEPVYEFFIGGAQVRVEVVL
jgi:hypothetical protein